MAASASPSMNDQTPSLAEKIDETISSSEKNSGEEKYVRNGADNTIVAAQDAMNVEIDTSTSTHDDQGRLKGFRLVIVLTSVLLALFCVALDNTSELGPGPRLKK